MDKVPEESHLFEAEEMRRFSNDRHTQIFRMESFQMQQGIAYSKLVSDRLPPFVGEIEGREDDRLRFILHNGIRS